MGVDRSIPTKDLYRELEVDAGASTEAIEAAYRSLMKQHHPDRAGPDGLARAKRLNLAHDWLADPERRARYDTARGALRMHALRSTTRPPAPAGGPGSIRASPHRHPPPTRVDQAHQRRTTGRSPVARTAGLAAVGIVAVVAAALALGGGSSAAREAGRASSGALVGVTSGPTLEPTPAPTSESTVSRPLAPTAAATSAATPGPTQSLAPAPVGRADLRFSGMYAERYDEPLGGTSGCTTTAVRGNSVPTLTGFEVDSGSRSGERWQLTLADLVGSWSMDIFFEDTADGLWWNSGVGVGSVTRIADGFAFDVVMTDSAQSLRAKGTVTCK